MKLLIMLLFSCSASTCFAEQLISPIVSEMHEVFKEKDYQSFKNKELILRQKNINKSPWPEVTVYFTVDAEPLETVALFAAFEHQKNYVPDLLKSRVIKQLSPTNIHTEYEMKMPWPIPNSRYVHATSLKKIDTNTYRVEWHMVKSNSAEIVKGYAEFYPYEGKTIFKYQSFIRPKSFLAGMFKKTMIKDVLNSLKVIRAEAEKVRATDKGKQFIEQIKLALSGKYFYKNGRSAK